MQVHISTIKRERQTRARQARNQNVLSRLKTLLKKADAAIAAGDAAATRDAVDAVISAYDKAASKKLIHKNKASRTISRLTRRGHPVLSGKAPAGESGPGPTGQPSA